MIQQWSGQREQGTHTSKEKLEGKKEVQLSWIFSICLTWYPVSWAAVSIAQPRFLDEFLPVLLGRNLHMPLNSVSPHLSFPLCGSLSSVVSMAVSYWIRSLLTLTPITPMVLGWCLPSLFPFRPCVFTLELCFCSVPAGVAANTWILLLVLFTSSPLKLWCNKNHKLSWIFLNDA